MKKTTTIQASYIATLERLAKSGISNECHSANLRRIVDVTAESDDIRERAAKLLSAR